MEDVEVVTESKLALVDGSSERRTSGEVEERMVDRW